jgi:uncharacterized membrane protein (DUF373 family)
MSNPVVGSNETEHSPEASHHSSLDLQPHKPHDPIGYFSGLLLEKGDSIIYAVVGICFFLGALIALGYSLWDFVGTILTVKRAADAASAIIKLVSDLLLVLIIMEVLGTVIHYLKSHATSLRPFLFIGIISATRGILSIGARLSVETVGTDEFYHSMIELGVNALVILALGITLKLLGRMADER